MDVLLVGLGGTTPPFPAGSPLRKSASKRPFFCSTGGPDAVHIESTRTPAWSLVIILLLAAGGRAVAQDKGTLDLQALPPLANPDVPKTPAKQLFVCKV